MILFNFFLFVYGLQVAIRCWSIPSILIFVNEIEWMKIINIYYILLLLLSVNCECFSFIFFWFSSSYGLPSTEIVLLLFTVGVHPKLDEATILILFGVSDNGFLIIISLYVISLFVYALFIVFN